MPQTLHSILEYLASRPWSFREILVVDDGSRDGTVAVAEEFSRRYPEIRVLRNPGNRGKGYSVRHGVLEARGDWILFTDADLSAPIEELNKLLESAERKHADVAIGSRGIDRSLIQIHQSIFRETAGRIFNFWMWLFTGLPFWDTQCGFKLFTRRAGQDIFGRQQIERFGFDVEVLFLARKLGYKTVEVPVRWAHVEGTKVSMLRDSVAMFTDLLRVRWYHLTGCYKTARHSAPEKIRTSV